MGRRRAFAAGAWLGRLGYRIMAQRRRLARHNLWRALPHLEPGLDLEATARGCFEEFAGSLLEAMAASDAPARLMADGAVRFEGLDHATRALERGRGAVAVIGHMGNWELAGLAATQLPIPIVSVARPIHNPLLDGHFRRARARTGQRIVVNHGTIHQLVEILAAGSLVILPCDQWPKRGTPVELFGRPTLWLRTPAILALRSGAPVIPIRISREESHHRVELTEPILPERWAGEADPAAGLTREIARRIEGFVRLQPEQWLWMHDRWKAMPGAVVSERAVRAS